MSERHSHGLFFGRREWLTARKGVAVGVLAALGLGCGGSEGVGDREEAVSINDSSGSELVLTQKDELGAEVLAGNNFETGLWLFPSTGRGIESPSRIWMSGPGNMTLSRSQLVTGDFTGDGKTDFAAFYDRGNAEMELWVFPSTGRGIASPTRIWTSGPGGWNMRSSQLVAGDFTGDGKADLAAFYDYGNAQTGLWLFPSTGSGIASPTRIWMSGPGGWNMRSSQLVAGDFTGDGKADLAAFYDYGNAQTGLWLFPSTGGGIASPTRIWMSGPGGWNMSSSQLVAGDFTGDGKADLAAFYDYGNAQTGLWLFPSTGSGVASPTRIWMSGPGGWNMRSSQLVAGDFTGDGKADLAAFYDYGNLETGLWLFPSTGSGVASIARIWMSGPSAWNMGSSRLVAGDFTGDGKADLAAFYDYGPGVSSRP